MTKRKLREKIIVADTELLMLYMAIRDDDPKEELLIRVKDLQKRLRA